MDEAVDCHLLKLHCPKSHNDCVLLLREKVDMLVDGLI